MDHTFSVAVMQMKKNDFDITYMQFDSFTINSSSLKA